MRAIGPAAQRWSTPGGLAAFAALIAAPALAQEAPAGPAAQTPARAPAASQPMQAPSDAAPAPVDAPVSAEPKSDPSFSLDTLTTYGTLGMGASTGNAPTAPGDAGIFNAQIGARFGPYIGVEAETGAGVPGDSSPSKHVSLASRYAGYIVGYLPFNKHFDLFAKLGLGHSRYKFEDNGTGVSSQLDSINWGLGAQYFFTEHDGLRTEVLRETYHDSRGDRSSVFFSWIHRF